MYIIIVMLIGASYKKKKIIIKKEIFLTYLWINYTVFNAIITYIILFFSIIN